MTVQLPARLAMVVEAAAVVAVVAVAAVAAVAAVVGAKRLWTKAWLASPAGILDLDPCIEAHVLQ